VLSSPRARQAFDLYQECVAAGLSARLVLEQKQGGERISFTCRPAAVATYAAVAGGQRHPAAGGQHRLVADAAGGHRKAYNARRAERKRKWRVRKRAAIDATAVAAAEAVAASAAEPTAPVSSAPIPSAGSVTPDKLDTASTPPTRARPVISPRMTRARKKRKEMSPDSDCLEQLDGEVASPPASPASWVGSLSAPTQLIRVVCPVSPSATGTSAHLEPLALQFTTCSGPGSPTAPECTAGSPSAPSGRPSAPTVQQSSGSPTAPSPPPPPPWSKYLPSYCRRVICKICLASSHGIQFQTCQECYERGALNSCNVLYVLF
jgi:hypothetical protein